MTKAFNFLTIYAIMITLYAMYLQYYKKLDEETQESKNRLWGIAGLGASLSATLVPAVVGAGATVVTAGGNAAARKIEN